MNDDTETPETDVQPEAANAEVEDANEAATEEQEESATSEDATERPRKDKGVGKRINELTREKYEAKREAERLAAELEALRREKPQEAPKATRDKPTLESCGYDPEAFAEAVAEWKIEQSFAAREAKGQEAKAKESAEAQVKEFRSRVEKLEELSPGAWEKAITAPIDVTQPMLEIIQTSEVGPHIAVWLAENLDEADHISQISKSSPYQAAKLLGQIEGMIEGNLKSSRQKTTSSAPPPPPKVSGSATVAKSPENMTMAEFVAWRAKSSKRR